MHVQVVEHFNKDGSETWWLKRRDLVPGRTFGNVYATADGTIILRLYGRGLMSSTVDHVSEDYISLDKHPRYGEVVNVRMAFMNYKTGARAEQFTVGKRA